MAINFDPNVDYDAKKAQTNLSGDAPGWYDRMINAGASALRSAQPQGYVGGATTPMTAESAIAQKTAGQTPTQQAPGTQTATGSSTGSPPTVNDPNNASVSSGAALTPGLRRYSGMPGVYSGQSKDGSLYFTDDPNSAFTKNTVDPNGLRRSSVNVGSFSNADAGAANTGAYGFGTDLPAQTGINRQASDNLYARMQGQGDPNAGQALPSDSLAAKGYDTSANGLNGATYQDLSSQLNALNGTRATGDEGLANAALKARLTARIQDQRQGQYPGGYPGQGGFNGAFPGAPGQGGGLSYKDILDYQQKNAELNQQGVLGEQRIQDQRSAQQEGDLKDLESHYGQIQDPRQKASLLFSRVPNNPQDLKRWLPTREGQFVTGQLNNDIGNVSGGLGLFGSSAGGETKGAGLGSLAFDPSNPNDFTIGRHNSALPDLNAREFGLFNRLPDPYYSTDNVSKLRSLRRIMAPDSDQ